MLRELFWGGKCLDVAGGVFVDKLLDLVVSDDLSRLWIRLGLVERLDQLGSIVMSRDISKVAIV